MDISKCALYDPRGCHQDIAAEIGCAFTSEGVAVLGSEHAHDAGAWFSVEEGEGRLPAVTQARVDRALHLGEVLLKTIESGSRQHSVAPAVWHLLRTVLNIALDYDSHILAWQPLWTACGDVDECVLRVVSALLRVQPSELPVSAIAQLRLHWNLGGFSSPSAQGKLSHHFLEFLAVAPEATLRLSEWLQLPLCEVGGVLAPELAQCRSLLQALERERGILVAEDGTVSIAGSGAAAPPRLHASDMWQCVKPLSSEIREALDTMSRAQLLEGSCWPAADNDYHCARVRALAGDCSGRALIDHPSASGQPILSSRQWALVSKFRLGIRLGSCRCGLKTLEEVRCASALDAFGCHALHCQTGVLCTARHSVLRSFSNRVGRSAGYAGIIEQCIPEFGLVPRKRKLADGSMQESLEAAYIDCLLTSHATQPDVLIDVTWRSPFALHLLSRSARGAGIAAADGERDKARRYKEVDGFRVSAWSCELTGCISGSLSADLRRLAVLAAEVQAERGMRASDWDKLWRGELSAIAMRACALAFDKAYTVPHGGSRELV